jgi:hypothetical protein
MSGLSRVKSKGELLTLQREFARIIRKPLKQRAGEDRMERDVCTEQMIAPNEMLSSHERLELYARQYWWRIRDSLREDFPGVQQVLGEMIYYKVSELYLAKHHSRSFTLRNLGRMFPQFLLRCAAVPRAKRRLVSEVAQLEWDKIEVFDAPSSNSQLVAKSAGKRRERYTLSPALRLRALAYPAHRIIRGGTSGSDHQATSNTVARRKVRTANLTRAAVSRRSTFVATHRYNGKLYFKELSKDEFTLMQQISRRGSIDAALRVWRPSIAVKRELSAWIARTFQEWGSLNWICVK